MKCIPQQDLTERIAYLEKNELWDTDATIDPPTVPLKPKEVDYLDKKLSRKIMNKIANRAAIHYFEGLIDAHILNIEAVNGIENYLAVDGGAIITCNHFNAFDNYAVFHTIRPYLGKRNLYKIIREGNFTSFKGLYGFFFRHCNTLPLSPNFTILKKLLEAVSVLLNRGEKILIYPEQAMWQNYKKPRPLKDGAFNFAVKNKKPVIPFFITFKDSEKYKFDDGTPAQEYTMHILPAIYPDEKLTDKENIKLLKEKNYQAWVSVYEKVYGIPLKYGE